MKGPDDPEPDHSAPMLPYDPALRQRALTDATFWRDTAVRLYAESPPRPTQVTQTQAAELLGVAPRTVRRWTPGNPMLLVLALAAAVLGAVGVLILGPPTRFGPMGW